MTSSLARNKTNNYKYYLIPIPFLLVFSYLFNNPVDIHLHDVFLVLTHFHLAVLFSVFLFISGIGYYAFRRNRVNRKLTIAHNLMSLIGLLAICISSILQYFVDKNSQQGKFEEYKNIDISVVLYFGKLIGTLLLLVAFLCYLINILMTTYRALVPKGKEKE